MAIINDLPCGSGGGLTKELLWTNPNPNLSFSGQSINIDISGYDYLLVKFQSYGGSNKYFDAIGNVEDLIANKGIPTFACASNYNSSTYSRPFSLNSSGSSIGVYQSYKLVNGATGSLLNTTNIPYQIYGVKGEIN